MQQSNQEEYEMSVYAKLMRARLALQNRKLNKTGFNKFAGYAYFELADFLPAIQEIFHDVGLCGVISFDAEVASLTITDVDKEGQIVITSPMAEANLKGCHPIQNLGAVETYTRRYLWVTAMEIVEHDALDATTGKDQPKSVKSSPLGEDPFAMIPQDEHDYIRELAERVRSVPAVEAEALIAAENLETEQKVALWSLLDSKTRSAIKKVKDEHKV